MNEWYFSNEVIVNFFEELFRLCKDKEQKDIRGI